MTGHVNHKGHPHWRRPLRLQGHRKPSAVGQNPGPMHAPPDGHVQRSGLGSQTARPSAIAPPPRAPAGGPRTDVQIHRPTEATAQPGSTALALAYLHGTDHHGHMIRGRAPRTHNKGHHP
eukprot:118565-Chlamydomonas_euryale.AAC.7